MPREKKESKPFNIQMEKSVYDTIRKIERFLKRDKDCIKCCLLCQASHLG